MSEQKKSDDVLYDNEKFMTRITHLLTAAVESQITSLEMLAKIDTKESERLQQSINTYVSCVSEACQLLHGKIDTLSDTPSFFGGTTAQRMLVENAVETQEVLENIRDEFLGE